MWYLLVLVLFLASCGGNGSKATRHAEKKFKSKRNAIDIIRQQEAKLFDIPIPLSSHPIVDYCLHEDSTPQQIILGYECALSARELEQFFNQEMERFGWRYSSAFTGYERLMQYEKPDRVCSISLRPKGKRTELLIFAGNKQESA